MPHLIVKLSLRPAYEYLKRELLSHHADEEFIGSALALIVSSILDSHLSWVESTATETVYTEVARLPGMTMERSAEVCRETDQRAAQCFLMQLPDFGSKAYQGIYNYRFINHHDVQLEITPPLALTYEPADPHHRLSGVAGRLAPFP